MAGIEKDRRYWFVMRDLSRPHSKNPSYKILAKNKFEIFMAMRHQIRTYGERVVRVEVPLIPDLLFVHSTKAELDPFVDKIENLQYRYVRGAYLEPMIVPEEEMQRFIRAVKSTKDICYYLPSEVTPDMCGRMVRIKGGKLNNYTGRLLNIQGQAKKRLLLELSGFLAVGIEINEAFIEFI